MAMAQAPRNVIFIGETGSGKSSVINLILGHSRAAVSSDAAPCTNAFTSYEVSIEGRTYVLWDTPGLNEASGFVARIFKRWTSTMDSLRGFLQDKRGRGELDLLVFCMQGNRASNVMSKVYKVFCCPTHRTVPVVIAITRLERAEPTMDAWWQDNERRLGDLGLVFDGHACLTCLSPHHRRWASQDEIRALISAEYLYRPRSWSIVSERDYLNDSGCVVS